MGVSAASSRNTFFGTTDARQRRRGLVTGDVVPALKGPKKKKKGKYPTNDTNKHTFDEETLASVVVDSVQEATEACQRGGGLWNSERRFQWGTLTAEEGSM